MSDFINDKQCVTHHNACDCREEHFRELQAENKRLREAIAILRTAISNLVKIPPISERILDILAAINISIDDVIDGSKKNGRASSERTGQ